MSIVPCQVCEVSAWKHCHNNATVLKQLDDSGIPFNKPVTKILAALFLD